MNRLFSSYKWKGGFWFRVFGYGIHGKDLRDNDMLFSERMKKVKHYYFGSWSFKFLVRRGH